MQNLKSELVATYGTLQGGWGPGEFDNPAALATDTQGNLIVCDTGNHRVQKFDREGNLVWMAGGKAPDGKSKPGTAPSDSGKHDLNVFEQEDLARSDGG